jgi:hypothetical protein
LKSSFSQSNWFKNSGNCKTKSLLSPYTSVPKQPVLAVASYSALLLASLQAFGAQRGPEYAELPKWRRNARRPSCLDLITLLRKEMAQQTHLLVPLGIKTTHPGLVQAAAA